MSNIKELMGEAETAFENAEYDKAKELCLEGINKLEKSKDTESIKTTIKFLNILSECDNIQGKWFNSTLNLERIIELAEEHKYPSIKAEAMIKVGAQLTKSGKWEKARVKFENVKKMVEKFENPYLLGLTLSGLGEISFRTGKAEEAINTGQKIVEIGEKIDNQELIGKATNIIMVSWYEIGDFEKALEANSKTIEAYKKLKENSRVAMALNNRGSIYKIIEEYEKSLDCYNEGLDSVGDNAAIHELAYFYPNIAECHALLGQASEAEEIIKKAEIDMKDSEDKYAVAYLWMVKGMVETLNGNEDLAINWLHKAEKRMKALNVSFDTGMIAIEHSKALTKFGYEYDGLAKLKEALAYFEEGNSKYMIEKTKKLIEKSAK